MADSFAVQCALQDAKGRVFTGLSRHVRPGERDALSFIFEDGGEIEIPGSTPDYLIMAAVVFETKVSVGGVYVREMLNDVTDVSLVTQTGVKIARVRLMRPPTHMAEGRGDICKRLSGKTIDAVRLSNRDVSAVYWDNRSRCHKAVSFDAVSVRVNRLDGSDAWRLIDEDGHAVFTVELAQPNNQLPVYVARAREALIGSRVQSVSVSDGGLYLHLDDDYDAVTNGSLRVRVDSERVPFTVGDVFVNRGGGAGLTLCICAKAESKPVVAFKIDPDVLNRKEMVFSVI